MKRKKWYLAIAILAATSGCAGMEDCRYEHVQKLRARSEYHKCGAPECEKFAQDYKRGYLDGFYTVSTGGPCCPPAVAPARYYRVKAVLGDCDNRRHSYYHGWQDGASRASCFPDTHYLRLFETCECQVPRCESCTDGTCGCNACGIDPVGVHDPGLINGDWTQPTPTIVNDDPIYPGAYDALPSPIAVDEDDAENADDDDDAKQNSDRDADEAGDDDAELLPPTQKSSDADLKKEESIDDEGPSDRLELDDTIDDDDIPSPSDLNEDGSEQTLGKKSPATGGPKPAVVAETLQVVDPSTVTDKTDRAIEAGSIFQVETVEVAPETTEIQSASAKPLDRNTIQAIFGIDEDFDFRSAGTVSYQTTDPIASVKDEALPNVSGADDSASIDVLLEPNEVEEPTVQSAPFDPTSIAEPSNSDQPKSDSAK